MEIRVGQVWQENKYNRRVMRIEDLVRAPDGSPFAANMRLVRGNGRPETTVQAYILRAGWNLLEEAPDAPVRQIKLTLAKNTTATECGGCGFVQDEELGASCRLFQRQTSRRLDAPRRLSECIAAEVK